MILAAILRNYKCYKGINIIPFGNDSLDYLNIIIGNNGVGKSAILEGLDTLFNDAQWIVNNEIRGKKEDVSVGAVMLIEKNRAAEKLDAREKQILAKVSDFFWNVEDANPTLRQYAKFFDLRNSFLDRKDDYYLIVVGREFEHKDLLFLTFTSLLRSSLDIEPKPENYTLSKLLYKVLSFYTYIYIPVETSISDFVKLQNQSFQTLMDTSVKNNIAKELNKGRITRGGGKRKHSLLELINELLEQYVKDVESDIQSVNSGYSYKPAPRQYSKLTANHVVDTIVAAYYSKRSFKKDGKEIQFLSSGEKRLILVDIISAFVKKRNASHELIIAVDEPENSLHISKCYDQFQHIEDLALNYNHQLFITTHWYGSLPCVSKGSLIHIDQHGNPDVTNLYNYYEKRGDLPEDVYLKGFFDLSSSLLYAFRSAKTHWLLVEGYEDKKYLEYHLQNKNVRIIPLGGCSNVRKVYEYLHVPLTDKDFKYATKKIVCLIDTDALCTVLGISSGGKDDILKIRRLHEQDDGEITLLEVDNPTRKETEIEDVLDPKQFFDSLEEAINEYGEDEDKEAFATFTFDESAKNSRIKGDNSILKVNKLTRNAREDKQRVISFVDTHKEEIANKYTAKSYAGTGLSWVAKLNDLLK